MTFHLHGPAGPRSSDACIRCGWCAEICPARLAPAILYEAALRSDVATLAREHVTACADCGLCTVICPSHLPLHHTFSPERRPTEARP
ncbi:MAG: 4Fe-4S binding protein [Tepidisphaeraceae bacterium]